jgi:DUF1680 family protein
MTTAVHRRDFIKSVSAAAGTVLCGSRASDASPNEHLSLREVAVVPILSAGTYTPRAYPIEAKPFTEVALNDTFWRPKMARNASVTIPFEIQKFQENEKPFANNVVEAAIYSLQTYPDAELKEQVARAIRETKSRYASGRNARNDFFEVAAAYYTHTGSRELLDPAITAADALYSTYQGSDPPFAGGERDAINCLALYSATKDKRHLDLAKHYLDIRGLPNSAQRSRHNQSYKPVLEQNEAVGHAVNDASLMVSLVDVGTLTGERDYLDAVQRIWTDVVTTKLYVTGGIGSTGNEGFGPAYSLPNLSAYAETCAAIMFATFNHKMFLATGDSKYIDVMERTMYNNVADGVGVDGKTFFYVNRLASASDGRNVRWQRASLECCPPNLVRFMASMPRYLYAQRGNEIFVNLYVSSETAFSVDGSKIALSVESRMPWEGLSTVAVACEEPVTATLRLRIPGWIQDRPVPSDLYVYASKSSATARVTVNGKSVSAAPDRDGYVSIDRRWKKGDVIAIDFPLEVRPVVAHSKVHSTRGRVALERGPIVYCAEWPDCAGGKVLTARLDRNTEIKPLREEKFLDGGATLLETAAKSVTAPASSPAAIRLIPYHLWANRGVGEMAVWLSKDDYAIGDVGPAGGLIFYINANYAADSWRFLEAAPFDQSSGAKWGSFRIPLTGAHSSAIGTGRQNTLDIKKGCATSGIAADLCTSFSFNGFEDWFLPSFDELQAIYVNLKQAGLGGFPGDMPDNCDYWSSTQVSTDMARHIDFADNGMRSHFDDKDYPRRVRAIRAV